ncbi:MAG: hypothetical protein MUQ00_00100, partial [Candidatus Aminicenantes bacterium]|nr:hypothetical protein [Candidatus Aminicenantes bacterium]
MKSTSPSVTSAWAGALLLLVIPLVVHFGRRPAPGDRPEDRVSLRSSERTLAAYEAETLDLRVTVRNEGRSARVSTGKNPCLLSYHLLDGKGRL